MNISGLRAAAGLIALAMASSAEAAVRTSGGLVRGVAAPGAEEYLGTPYASPPVGALRWRPPQPTSWTGVLGATTLPPACPQTTPARGIAATSEDCLFLNVYTPLAASRPLPVMLWIHGGSDDAGTGADYDGSALVRHGVIVVTINYRLGFLGFLAHPALDAESPGHGSGDYGLMDQQAALRWVGENIAAFGGDPARITVFGESAGGQNVIDQLISPAASGLFARAIVESGAYAAQLPTLQAADAKGVAFARAVGCTSMSDAGCLRALPVGAIIAAQDASDAVSSLLAFEPNVGTATLPLQPLLAFGFGRFSHVPVIIGTNHDEARLFTAGEFDVNGAPLTAGGYEAALAGVVGAGLAPLTAAVYPLAAYPSPDIAYSSAFTDVGFACLSRVFDRLISQSVPTFAYEFADENAARLIEPADPFMPLGAPHTSELPFLWPNLIGAGGVPETLTASEASLSSDMSTAWTNFASSGDPNGPGAAPWPTYDAASDQFHEFVPGGTTTSGAFTGDHKCGVWEPLLVLDGLLPAGSL